MALSLVMVVDDSEADQFICEYTLKKYNPDIVIMSAFDGQEALDMLEAAETRPQVIFLDINMPRMNGHEFLAKYTTLYEADNASVVVMLTSSDQTKDVERSMAYEAVMDYFIKPLSEEDIVSLCDRNANLCR